MGAIDGACEQNLTAVHEWFQTLPRGVAELSTVGGDGLVAVEIAPLNNLAASALRVEFADETFSVRTGKRFYAPDRVCAREASVPYCEAVVAGELYETALLRQGQVVGWETNLQVDGRRFAGRRFFHPMHERWYDGRLRWFRRGRGQRRIRYSPYFERLPLAADPVSSALIKPPVFEDYGGYVDVYQSAASAEGYTEVFDVENRPWYDSDGRLLRMTACDPAMVEPRDWWVKMECVEPEPQHANRLREGLRTMLSHAMPGRADSREATLQELVRMSLAYAVDLWS